MHYDRYRNIRRTYDEVERQLRNSALGDDLLEWGIRQYRAVRPQAFQVLRGDVGYREFLLAYVSEAADKPREGSGIDLADSAYDDYRELPVCTCTDRGCHLKNGTLPPTIREAATIDAGVREFIQAHTGHPIVLVGTPGDESVGGAREAWRERCAQVEEWGYRLHTVLSIYDEPPEDSIRDMTPDAQPPVDLRM